MRRQLSFLLFFSLLTITLSADTLRGVVKDSAGQPLPGASVSVENVRTVTTDADGVFSFELPTGTYPLRVTHPGFRSHTSRVATGDQLEVTLAPAFAETMVVSAIRAEVETPVTKTDIPREQIERQYHGQDIPLLLRDAPSINAFSESGVGGSGYSYITLRGVSSSRINFTLDGVPLADSEDMGTYFADFPDLARSLESVQIQRGVGTSTVGSASFGGSVNLQSIELAQEQKFDVTLGAGSFGNQQVSVGYHSGALPGDLAFYTRVSFLENDGFREGSEMRQRNVFFSGTKQFSNSQLKLTGFSGVEAQQSSYYAADAETLKTNLRANPLQPEEKDRFLYDVAQLQYIRPVGDDAAMTASAYYQRGYGWFRLFSSAGDLRDYGLDGRLLGSMLTYSRSSGALTTNYGVHANHFKRDHTRDNLTTGVRNYANYGIKNEANGFAKASYVVGSWLFYGDAQIRHATFDYYGSVEIPGIDWTFFNPKVGARYTLSPASSLYASVGMSTREPARNDMFLGQDNPSIVHDLRAVRPERLFNVETGWNHRAGNVDLAANLYAMEYRNEIALTGEQSDIGLSLRRNVDRSYRRGIELEAGWQVAPEVRLKTNATFSRNRIREWTQFYDVYDAEWNWVDATSHTFRNVQPLLSPEVLINQAVEYTPGPRFSSGLVGRYVGRSYLDNSNARETEAPAFFLLDANVSYAVTSWARLSLQVNNVFDNDRIYPSGYSYLYYLDGQRTGTAYYYPQATRNAVVLLTMGW
jgi:iron complex outermembrane recepter protein